MPSMRDARALQSGGGAELSIPPAVASCHAARRPRSLGGVGLQADPRKPGPPCPRLLPCNALRGHKADIVDILEVFIFANASRYRPSGRSISPFQNVKLMDLDRVAYDYENRQSYGIKYSFFWPFIQLIFSRQRERGSARASAVDGYQKYWHAARSWGAGCSRGERDRDRVLNAVNLPTGRPILIC